MIPTPMIILRECRVCGLGKPLTAFPSSLHRAEFGRLRLCKICNRRNNKEYYDKMMADDELRAARYDQLRHNRMQRLSDAEYRSDYNAKRNERKRERYANDEEYRERSTEEAKKRWTARRTHKLAVCLERQENICAGAEIFQGCLVDLEKLKGKKRRLHIDHIVPRSRGGSDELANLQALCEPCNLNKYDRTMAEWSRYLSATMKARRA